MSTQRRWEIDDAVARRLANASEIARAQEQPRWRRGGFGAGLAGIILLCAWAAWGPGGFLSLQGSVGAGVLPAGGAASSGESSMSNMTSKSTENSRFANVAASAAVAFAAVSFSPEIDASCAQGSGECEGDINGDGAINGIDLAIVLTNWGPCTPPPLPWATTIEAFPDPAVVTDAALRQKIIETNLPWRVRDNASNIEMLLVPPGTFMMGCSASVQNACETGESPVNQVTLTSAFYLGRTEVTQAQWAVEMGSNPSQFSTSSDSPSRPVERVSWNSVQPFLTQNVLRLPTEAEWEYAYRAGTSTAFHNGSNDDATLGAIAWYSANAGGQTHAVGGKLPNALGLHDMSGNVWEWVNDWWGYYPSSAAVTNPQGPVGGTGRVLRSGGWQDLGSETCRASRRYNTNPGYAAYHIGFRVARNP